MSFIEEHSCHKFWFTNYKMLKNEQSTSHRKEKKTSTNYNVVVVNLPQGNPGG